MLFVVVGLLTAAFLFAVGVFQNGKLVTQVTLLPEKVSFQELVESSVVVANQMEREREVPATINVGTYSVAPEVFLYLVAGAIVDYAQGNATSDKMYVLVDLASSREYYPAVDMLSSGQEGLYGEPFSKSEYIDFFETVRNVLGTTDSSLFPYRSGSARLADVLHFGVALLRYESFFDSLPPIHDLQIISPIGLVPWNTPEEEKEFISLLAKHPKENRFYGVSAGQYQTFKQAKEIVGDASDPFTAAERIYKWVRWDTWSKFGYYTYLSQFLGEVSAPERWRFRMSTSGGHNIKNLALLRALGIPARTSQVYLPPHGWVNYDVHRAFGDEPVASYNPTIWTSEASPPTLDDPLIQQIRYIASLAGSGGGQKDYYLVINGADVITYGAGHIATQAKNGGFSGIVLNVKTTMGYLYYQSDLYPNRVFSDALTPLLQAGNRQGLKIYAGFNVLNDILTLREHWQDDWHQPPDIGASSVSPCKDEYRNINKVMLGELVNTGIDGVMLHSLFFMFGDGAGEPDPNCDLYRIGDNWQSRVITTYTQDLTQSLRALNPNIKVVMNSVPLRWRNSYSVERSHPSMSDQGQDLVALSGVVDELVLTFVDNMWLTLRDIQQVGANDPATTRLKELNDSVSTLFGASFYFNDEWEFPVEYYQGLNSYFNMSNLQSIFLTSPVSQFGGEVVGWEINPQGEANQGPAFSRLQWEKIGSMGLGSIVNRPEILVPIGNKTVLENELLQFSVDVGESIITPVNFQARPLPPGALFVPLGDVSLDGDLTSVDALLVSQYLKGLINLDSVQFTVADVDKNGLIQQADVDLLLDVITGGKNFPLNEYLFLWEPTLEQAGVYFITFTASDDSNKDFETISVVALDKNFPPRLDPLSDRIISEGQSFVFTVTAVDPEDDRLTFDANPLPIGARFVLPGDVNLNGELDVGDGLRILRHAEGIEALAADLLVIADVDENGIIEKADADLVTSLSVNPRRWTKYIFIWTPESGQAGVYQIVFSVSDSLSTDSTIVNIIVEGPQPAPCESFGDIDRDGFVTQDDVEMVLNYVVGDIRLDRKQKTRAEVDGNKKVDAVDALLILQYVERTRSTFPVCDESPETGPPPKGKKKK